MAVVTQQALVDALIRSGFISANDVKNTRRITITLDVDGVANGRPVKVDIERMGDTSLVKALDEFKED